MAKTLRVGLIGYRFMGRAHSNAWRQAPRFFPLKANIELHTVADFVNACVEGKPSPPTFEDGLINQRVLAAVEESSQKKKWVRV